MNFTETKISGLWIIEPKVFTDARGYFAETWKRSEFEKYIGKVDFIQDNESRSSRGVFRGFHFQAGASAQAKLVRAVVGTVWDIAVDIRPGSPTFGQWEAVELSGDNHRQFFIPRGMAHGFLVLSETAVFAYKVDNVYSPADEKTLNCFDADLGVNFPIERSQIILSDKDRAGLTLKDLK
jgi:dTDP-4-dehydrorhamnose 3,5-epimerase